VGIPALFVDISIVTDLTSIGTLFAFVLVCAGVLNLPREEHRVEQRFRLPYINGAWFCLPLLLIFMYFYLDRIKDAFMSPVDDPLFLIFIIIASVIAILTTLKRLSLIPILGMTFCLYLMVEIPTRSWLVFFVWMAIGLAIYFAYGYKKSHLNK
jgi:APA family basic amino acid/polyamine antiporter